MTLLCSTQTKAAPFAVNPEVATILQRADDAIVASEGQNLLGLFVDALTVKAEWSRFILSAVTQRLDESVQNIERHRSLFKRTTCFQTDLTLMESKMEFVRAKMNEAFVEKRVFKMMQLSYLYEYLSQRYEYLARGGLNPTVKDMTARARRGFDPVNATFLPGPVCFYHSDYTSPGYLLPTRDGYGCDAQTLKNIKANLPTGTNFATLAVEVDREFQSMTIIQLAAETYIGNSPGNGGNVNPLAPRTHLTEYGCMKNGRPNAGVVLEPLRGNFSIERDNLRLMLTFRTLRAEQDAARPDPSRLQDEIGQNLINSIRRGFRSVTRIFSNTQAKRQSATLAVSTDTLLSIRQSVQSLGSGVGRLSKLATMIDEQPGQERGLRSFVRDYAFFLYRSCVAYSCAARLERIARIALTKECFPYTNGEYLEDKPSNPRWVQCMEEAL